MGRRRFAALLSALALSIAAMALSACGSSDEGGESASGTKEIKVLVPAPLTGDYAEEGHDVVNGAKMAAAWLNEQGGIQKGELKGAKFKIEEADDGLSTEAATTIASKFVEDDSYYALDGFIVSGLTAAAGAVTQRAGLPVFAGYTCADFLIDKADNIIVNCASLSSFGRASTNFVASLGTKRFGTIAVDQSINESYYTGIEEEAKASGMEWASKQTFSPDTTNFAPLITNLRKANVDAVMVGALQADAGRILSQMRRQGFDVPFVDFEGVGWGETFLKTAGEAAVGAYAIDTGLVFGAAPTGGFYDEMADRYQKEYGKRMPAGSLHAFDSIVAIGKAIEAGATKREDLAKYVTKITGDGLAGELGYNEDLQPKSRTGVITRLTSHTKQEREVEAVYEMKPDGVRKLK
jgi:branched-chain amino acid transport system substrate-binding protein